MECERCGYVMDAFTTQCPRCQRYGEDVVRIFKSSCRKRAASPPRSVSASAMSRLGVIGTIVLTMVVSLILGFGLTLAGDALSNPGPGGRTTSTNAGGSANGTQSTAPAGAPVSPASPTANTAVVGAVPVPADSSPQFSLVKATWASRTSGYRSTSRYQTVSYDAYGSDYVVPSSMHCVVSNDTEEFYEYVTVDINLYDAEGVQIGSASGSMQNVEPHGKFRVTIDPPSNLLPDIASCKVVQSMVY